MIQLNTPQHIPKGLNTLLHRHLLGHVHCCSIHNKEEMKQLKCPSTKKWMIKIWHIYYYEYYAHVKKNATCK